MNLKELSQKLGLSQTTVSRALNGYPEVSEATRRRVLDAAALHNYSPNVRAKSLATGKTLTIGHVIPVSTKHEMVNPIFADFIAGAGETYSRAGYDLLLSVVADQDEEQVYRDMAARGTVDGVIVHGPRVNDPRIELLQSVNLPFVVHGRSSEVSTGYSWLDVNNRRAFYRATRFLIDLGHRRIGLINGLGSMDFAARRRTGYADALNEADISLDPLLMDHDEMTEPFGSRSAARMLDADDPPTAFLVSSIIPAFGARRAIEARGLRLGRDVSIVVFDDDLSYFQSPDDVPVFTAVRSSVRQAGRIAAEMLLTQIRGGADIGSVRRLLEADLTIGHSTGPVPRNRAEAAE